MVEVSIKKIVEDRLRDKERLDTPKKHIGNDQTEGTYPLTDEEKQYMANHDIVASQVTAIDPEITFSFNPPLWNQRLCKIASIIDHEHIKTIIDYGCGSGKFIKFLRTSMKSERDFYGVDIDKYEITAAESNCSPFPFDHINKRTLPLFVHLYIGSILCPEPFLRDKDALVCIEVMEHILRPEANQLADVVLGYLRPKIAVFSTPNQEFNVIFKGLENGRFRHWDHKFEMTRFEFQKWGKSYGEKYGYHVVFTGVGDRPADYPTDIGYCSQIAIFTRIKGAEIMFHVTEEQQMEHVATISFPTQSPLSCEDIKQGIHDNIDYFYRQLCRNSDNEVYDEWFPIEMVLSFTCKEFEDVEPCLVQEILQESSSFIVSDDKLNMKGTEAYVQENDPMACDDEEYDDYY